MHSTLPRTVPVRMIWTSPPDSPKMPNDTNHFANPKPAEPSSHHEVVLHLRWSPNPWSCGKSPGTGTRSVGQGDAEQMIQAQMLINRLTPEKSR